MVLEIQKLLQQHDLNYVQQLLKLDVKQRDNLVLLKYNQLDADWTQPTIRECRGIILDSDNNWNVVAYPYKKFFNHGEIYADTINWENTYVFDKCDGSLLTLFYYNNDWILSTTGTIYADSLSNDGNITFAELFWKSVNIMYGSKQHFISLLNTVYNYMFELMTPFNIVVTQHLDYKILLHGVRNIKTLKEIHIHNFPNIFQVKTHDLKNINDIKNTFNDMTWQDEGYVICDNNFNRIKIKNPSYVSAHYIRSGMSPYHVMSVIKTNELSEFLIYFPTRYDELNELQEKYNNLINKLTLIYNTELKSLITTLSNKEYAIKAQEICIKYNLITPINFIHLFFSLKNNKHDIKSYINNISDKYLYNYLTN